MPERTRRSPARFLAPLALAGFLIVFLAVVSGSSVEDDGERGDRGRAQETREDRNRAGSDSAEDTGATTTRPRGPRTYTVKAGDTLGAISEQTGVTLERLQELNPELDPQAMVAGQRIKLRE